MGKVKQYYEKEISDRKNDKFKDKIKQILKAFEKQQLELQTTHKDLKEVK